MNTIKGLKRFAESGTIKKVKKFLLVMLVLIIVADVIFVFVDGIPTVSRVVLNSSPQLLVLIWMFGVITSNIFFPREDIENVRLKRTTRFLILTAIALLLLLLGNWFVDLYHEKSCSEIGTVCNPDLFICRLVDVQCVDVTDNFAFVDCPAKGVTECWAKVNIKVELKFTLFILGMICGYFLWPQLKDKS